VAVVWGSSSRALTAWNESYEMFTEYNEAKNMLTNQGTFKHIEKILVNGEVPNAYLIAFQTFWRSMAMSMIPSFSSWDVISLLIIVALVSTIAVMLMCALSIVNSFLGIKNQNNMFAFAPHRGVPMLRTPHSRVEVIPSDE
jgi:hypothetical protein